MTRRFDLVHALLTMMLVMITGCRNAAEIAAGRAFKRMPGADSVSLPGPSSIRPDGSVRNHHMDQPDGLLLKTRTASSLRSQQVDTWARNQALRVAAKAGLDADQVEGWIWITGPHELPVNDEISAQVYDVKLEIWKRAAEPRKRQREVE